MENVAVELCREIQGAQLAFVQSDEVSVLVHGYKKFSSQSYFDNNLQKIVSVAAAVAAATFTVNSWRMWSQLDEKSNLNRLRPAYFDARVFVLPEAEVNNYFVWRQDDATRNSVQMLASSLYSHNQLHKKNIPTMKQMCADADKPWESLPIAQQRGQCILRCEGNGGWRVDDCPPRFSQDKNYIEKHLALEDT